MPVASDEELTITTAPEPELAVAADALTLDTVGAALVVKAAVLALNDVVQLVLDEKAIAVQFTTFAAPAVLKVDVVKVPVPVPDEKLIDAVVEVTVFVPLTL